MYLPKYSTILLTRLTPRIKPLVPEQLDMLVNAWSFIFIWWLDLAPGPWSSGVAEAWWGLEDIPVPQNKRERDPPTQLITQHIPHLHSSHFPTLPAYTKGHCLLYLIWFSFPTLLYFPATIWLLARSKPYLGDTTPYSSWPLLQMRLARPSWACLWSMYLWLL